MPKLLTTIFILILLSPNSMFSQEEDAEWYVYRATPEINDIAIEGNYIWAGSGQGLIKINKITGVTTYFNTSNSGLPDNEVNCITTDANGEKWIGTDGGIAKFDGTNWTIYNKSNSGLPNDIVLCITIDTNGDKWIGTWKGMSKFDGTNWTVYKTYNSGLPYDDVRCITIDTNGDKWIGINGGGMAKFDGTNWSVYDSSNSGLPNNWVKCITIDTNGDKWIGINGGGIAKFDGINWTIYNTSNSGLPNDIVLCITIDTNGDKWIGTWKGMSKFDGTNWTVYNTDNSVLPDDIVRCITIDTNGDKWIGTMSGGISKFDDTNWTVYSTSNSGLPHNYVRCITTDTNGDKWIVTDDRKGVGMGMAKFDGTNWTVYNTSNSGLPDNNISSITIDTNGDKWIGTWGGGIAKFDGTNWTVYDTSNSGLSSNLIRCITIDSNGDKWIGIDFEGIVKFDGTNYITYNTSNSGLPNNGVMCITIDNNGDKWIGTWNGGIAKFDGTNWTVYNTDNSVLPDNGVMCITIDTNGDKWIKTSGTSYGGNLAKFDGTNWTVYNESNSGLPYDYVTCITIDGNGDKWIGTIGGIAKFDGSNWTVYNESNSGLPDDYVMCITIDTNGDKWIGTDEGGLAYFSEKIFAENIEGEYCAGESLDISYTTMEMFNPDNVFTAQLSDSTGMFYNYATPVIMGTDSARESGTINITIPKDVPYGEKYRIRVSGSSPFARGVDNGRNITIYPSPTPEIVNLIDTVVLPGSIVEYESNLSNEYLWKVERGIIETDSTQEIINVKWGDKGSGKITLIQTNEYGCIDSIVKTIKIQSDDLPTNVIIIVDSTISGKPGEFVQIPIYLLNSDSLNQYSIDGFTVDFKYNASMLLPVDENNRGSIVDGERIISLNLPRYPDFNKILTALDFKVELGNSISTILKLENLKTVGETVDIAKKDGKFELTGYCMEGGYPRLISNTGKAQLMLLSPNPSSESCELEYELIEKGNTKIYICNTYGEIVKTVLNRETIKPGKDKLTINTSGLSTGMYFIILQTPTIRKAVKMEVVK